MQIRYLTEEETKKENLPENQIGIKGHWVGFEITLDTGQKSTHYEFHQEFKLEKDGFWNLYGLLPQINLF